MSDPEIENLITKGEIKNATMVWNETMSEWTPAAQTPLSSFCPPPTPPPVAPSVDVKSTTGTTMPSTQVTMLKKASVLLKALWGKTTAAAHLSQKQALQQKLKTVDLNMADYNIGCKAFESRIAHTEYETLYSGIEEIKSQIESLKTKTTEPSETLKGKAKAAAIGAAKAAQIGAQSLNEKKTLIHLGVKLRENPDSYPSLSEEIGIAKCLIEKISLLDEEIQKLSTKTFLLAKYSWLILIIATIIGVSIAGYISKQSTAADSYPMAASGVKAVAISLVKVRDAGNAGDHPGSDFRRGAVSYEYYIGKYEVTNDQYTKFLNAVAASDLKYLYNEKMGSDPRGGIIRNEQSGKYTYSTKKNMGDKPVVFVCFWDAVRFVNWLHNGQGSGDTETGSYTLKGQGTERNQHQSAFDSNNVERNVGATWVVASEAEWYKAAYYEPRANTQSHDNYWFYPTKSDANMKRATADLVGNISNPGKNVANFGNEASWNGQKSNVTTVGSAGPSSRSYYGTYDQGGNVSEWNDTRIRGFSRGIRGGSCESVVQELDRLNATDVAPEKQYFNVGFRVVNLQKLPR